MPNTTMIKALFKSSVTSKYDWDTEDVSYTTKGWRWALVRWLIDVLNVEAELHKAICEHNENAMRRGQWRAFDKVLNWINEQEVRSIKKKDLYKYVMELRPE